MINGIPYSHRDLLERPLYAEVSTIRPDGRAEINSICFFSDGHSIRLAGTHAQAEYRNLLTNPAVTVSIADPGQGGRSLEIRGVLDHVEPDRHGGFFRKVSRRYGASGDLPLHPAARVVLVIRPIATSYQWPISTRSTYISPGLMKR